MSGDATLIVFVLRELRRSYATLPVRFVGEYVLKPQRFSPMEPTQALTSAAPDG